MKTYFATDDKPVSYPEKNRESIKPISALDSLEQKIARGVATSNMLKVFTLPEILDLTPDLLQELGSELVQIARKKFHPDLSGSAEVTQADFQRWQKLTEGDRQSLEGYLTATSGAQSWEKIIEVLFKLRQEESDAQRKLNRVMAELDEPNFSTCNSSLIDCRDPQTYAGVKFTTAPCYFTQASDREIHKPILASKIKSHSKKSSDPALRTLTDVSFSFIEFDEQQHIIHTQRLATGEIQREVTSFKLAGFLNTGQIIEKDHLFEITQTPYIINLIPEDLFYELALEQPSDCFQLILDSSVLKEFRAIQTQDENNQTFNDNLKSIVGAEVDATGKLTFKCFGTITDIFKDEQVLYAYPEKSKKADRLNDGNFILHKDWKPRRP